MCTAGIHLFFQGRDFRQRVPCSRGKGRRQYHPIKMRVVNSPASYNDSNQPTTVYLPVRRYIGHFIDCWHGVHQSQIETVSSCPMVTEDVVHKLINDKVTVLHGAH